MERDNKVNEKMKKKLTFFCGSKETAHDEYFKSEIHTLLTLLGDRYTYCYGGGNKGYMGQIYETSVDNNLSLTSINCERWFQPELKYDKEVLYTSILDRQNKLIEIADGYVVCPGGVGTIFEVFQAITMNDVKETNKPIFFLNSNQYFDHLFEMINYGRQVGTINKSDDVLRIYKTETAKELSELINTIFNE